MLQGALRDFGPKETSLTPTNLFLGYRKGCEQTKVSEKIFRTLKITSSPAGSEIQNAQDN